MLSSFIHTFLASFKNVHLHRLIKFPKYRQFYAWNFLSIFLMCGGLQFLSTYGGTWKIKCMQQTPTHYNNWKQVSGMKLTVFQKLN